MSVNATLRNEGPCVICGIDVRGFFADLAITSIFVWLRWSTKDVGAAYAAQVRAVRYAVGGWISGGYASRHIVPMADII